MEILGVGLPELAFVVIIALIVLGPKDMQKAGRTIGKWMRSVVTSEGWQVFQKTSGELRNLPARMMRDANEDIEKFKMQINADMDPAKRTKNPPRSVSTESKPASNSTPNLTPSDEQDIPAKTSSSETSTDDDSSES